MQNEDRRRIGEEIAQGYRRLPQTDAAVAAATQAAIASINEEPWPTQVAHDADNDP
jgi:hypothetical protein